MNLFTRGNQKTYAGILATRGKSVAVAPLRLRNPGTFFVTSASVNVAPPSPETSQE